MLIPMYRVFTCVIALMMVTACGKKDDSEKVEMRGPERLATGSTGSGAAPPRDVNYNNVGDTDEAVKNAILGYNEALIQFYLAVERSSELQKYASEKEMNKVGALVMIDREEGKIMKSRLTKIEFKSVDRKGTEARVVTHEEWKFVYLNIADGKPLADELGALYDVSYSLQKEGDKWLVAKLQSASRK